MKKWVIGFSTVILLLLVVIYILIPNIVPLKANIVIKATAPGIHRMLLDKESVTSWWPGRIKKDSLFLNDFSYEINEGNITVMPVDVTGKNTDLATSLYLISVTTDSTNLQWLGSIAASFNPVSRFLNYLKAKKINRDMAAILNKMKTFYSNPENIYGIKIKKTFLVDSMLIVTSGNCKGYPTEEFIYSLVNKLKNYATNNFSKESGFPMLNIDTIDSIYFEVKVALPIDKPLPSSGDILQKRMPAGNIILVTEVNGGHDKLIKAFEQIQKYTYDHQLKTAAIPFYSLVTDRIKEPDPNKWQTKIYCPVMIYGRDLN